MYPTPKVVSVYLYKAWKVVLRRSTRCCLPSPSLLCVVPFSDFPLMFYEYHLLQVGAGPAGLITALTLAKNSIGPRTFELFQLLGMFDDVQRLATPAPTMCAYKLPGGTQPVKTWDLFEQEDVWPDRSYTNVACLSQDALEGVMRIHLAKYGVTVELGKCLVGLEQDTGCATATIIVNESGQDEKCETVIVKYLVGADGAEGFTRKLLGLSFQGETWDADGQIWGDVEIKGLTTDYWHVWGKPDHFTMMARPFGHKFVISVTGQNFDPAGLAEPDKLPNIRMVDRFHEGRAFVAGDPAHVHSPTGAQGMNCSVQDASNLAWKIALVLKDLSSPTLLISYNAECLPIITQMLHATSALYTHTVATKDDDMVEQETTASEKATGDIVLGERGTRLQDRTDALAMAYTSYEGSGTLCAEDRAPETPGLVIDGKDTSLFRLFTPSHHTVLIFAELAEGDIRKALDSMAKYPEAVVQTVVITAKEAGDFSDYTVAVDRDSYARRAYLVEGDSMTIVIVRPDGFIGAIVNDIDRIDRPNMRMVDRFKGRAFVAGDSAHVHPPTGGQGMNCSVQDASNLAWKIAPPALLTSYYTESASLSSLKCYMPPSHSTRIP
ncbi:hypothetical protein PILCRDRAFT_655 [Piloderma croceum F 1598]|uniref:FAD-binding domain-containing protein n=1 Tax=Piloderma croceum (strain F 1598) TaxID=765440 RepID=A0A0C3GIL7_PILCF|nr:hypothetical protein PILCRDRAFT_655 [Piloderma croceum F 1598]